MIEVNYIFSSVIILTISLSFLNANLLLIKFFNNLAKQLTEHVIQ